MSDTFHLFGSFPYDIRRLIYAAYLSEQRARILHFSLGTRDHASTHHLRHDRLYAQPLLSAAAATRPSRTLAAVSREARHAVHALLPDTLEFYVHLEARDHLPDGMTVLEPRVLRFDGARNIISIQATYGERRGLLAMTDPARVEVGGLARFAGIRHLAVGLLRTSSYVPLHVCCPKLCEGPECPEECKAADNIPRFVRLFPDLTHLYIADIQAPHYRLSRDGCSCPPREQESGEGKGKGAGGGSWGKHNWPVVRGPDGTGDVICMQWRRFAIRGEPDDCPFELPLMVRIVRERYPGIGFPYYPALSHLKIRYLQPLPDWRGSGKAEDHVGDMIGLGHSWNGPPGTLY